MNTQAVFSDNQLIDALKKGSHQAFRHFFDLYKKRVYSFLLGIVRSSSDAEELTQVVFIKIWEHRKRLNQELSVNAYIYKIAKNAALNFIRQKVYKAMLEKELLENMERSEEMADKNMEEYINNLILKIPERRREIFLLRYRHKMSYREIAERLMISENTVDSQIRNALHFLRGQIGKELAMMILPFLIKIF